MGIELSAAARIGASAVLVAAVLGGCSSNGASGSGPAATSPAAPSSSASSGVPGSTITGRYLVRSTAKAHGHGLVNRMIGLFRGAGDPMAASPAEDPVATTRTGPDGRFTFSGVAPGKWVVAPTGTGLPRGAQSRPVRVTTAQGATVTVVACQECALPGGHVGPLR